MSDTSKRVTLIRRVTSIRITLTGNLEAAPELRYTHDNTPIARFRIATSEMAEDQPAQTKWHHIEVSGMPAEACSQTLIKGQRVCVEGQLQNRESTDQQGAKKSTPYVVALRVTILSPKASAQATAGANAGIEAAE